MVALIQKCQGGTVWITGFCGTPTEIAHRFLSSGVRELYQQAWAQSAGNLGAVAGILNSLLGKANSGQATRQDIENIEFQLGGFSYKCFGCAETNQEAVAICNALDLTNATNTCSSPLRQKQYGRFIEAMRTRYPNDVSDQEMNKILAAVMNLKL